MPSEMHLEANTSLKGNGTCPNGNDDGSMLLFINEFVSVRNVKPFTDRHTIVLEKAVELNAPHISLQKHLLTIFVMHPIIPHLILVL